jgi:hypothetical protein
VEVMVEDAEDLVNKESRDNVNICYSEVRTSLRLEQTSGMKLI